MSFISQNISRSKIFTVAVWLIGIGILLLSNYLYLSRIASFRFVDEYTNMVVGRLIQSGHTLHQDIFFHHHPLPVFISSWLQSTFEIQSIYELIKVHRYFVALFSLIASGVLLLRFRSRALLMVVVFEYTKYYLFGYQFLAEALIAYPIAYVCLLIFEVYKDKKSLSISDLLLATILMWWTLFQREPYAIFALFLISLLCVRAAKKTHIISCVLVFASLTLAILAVLPLSDYFTQVFELNAAYAKDELASNFLQYIRGVTYLGGYMWTAFTDKHFLYVVLAGASVTSIILLSRMLQRRLYVLLGVSITMLLLSGLRNIELGSLWYGMYRSIPHTIVLFSIVASFLKPTYRYFFVVAFAGAVVLLPSSHLFEKRDNATEFYVNYSHTDTVGQVIQALCPDRKCRLHIDGEDVLVYWQTGLQPWFRYSLFYHIQEAYLDYKSMRLEAFESSPPDIYYKSECDVHKGFMDVVQKDSRFVPVLKDGKTSCIWVTHSVFSSLGSDQHKQLMLHGYAFDTVTFSYSKEHFE